MKRLKILTQTKDKQSNESNNSNQQINNNYVNFGVTYFDDGYATSIHALGNPTILRTSLENVYETYKQNEINNLNRQAELKKPYKENLKRKETEIKKRETAKEIKNGKINDINLKIDKINSEITDVKNNPHKYGIDAEKKVRAQFYIGIFILLPLTLYLIVFYVSASYSAFFKQFNDSDIIAAIFDGHAFEKAIQQGWLEGAFVILLPFVFMGLGFIIHMFQKEKHKGNVIKIIGIITTTFIFDALLAYQIEKKIYEFEKTLSSPDFNFPIAFTKPEFWSIIFAGFIVYIIWGLVFDFVMKEYENIDKINLFINLHKKDREHLISKKEKLKNEIESIEKEISELQGEAQEIQSAIDGFIFEEKRYLLFHTEYLKGWLLAIQREIALPHVENNQLIKRCEEVSIEHLQNLGLENNINYENLM